MIAYVALRSLVQEHLLALHSFEQGGKSRCNVQYDSYRRDYQSKIHIEHVAEYCHMNRATSPTLDMLLSANRQRAHDMPPGCKEDM